MLAGAAPVLVHNCGGYKKEAEAAYEHAADLQDLRHVATNNAYPIAGSHGTTAVIGVRNMETGRISIRTGINGSKPAPDSWPQWAQDAFVQADGHAEEGIISSLAANEHIVFGAASRNVCFVCEGMMSEDMVLGGGIFPGKGDKTFFRMFWLDPAAKVGG